MTMINGTYVKCMKPEYKMKNINQIEGTELPLPEFYIYFEKIYITIYYIYRIICKILKPYNVYKGCTHV